MKKTIVFFCSIFLLAQLPAQEAYTWHEPKHVEGICKTDSTSIFSRLPANMKGQVRKPVWHLAQQTAGEFLHFKTTARSITIKYIPGSDRLSMPHMPATGVSGLDLYGMDKNGHWNWARPHYAFGDTIVFSYTNLQIASRNPMADFYLYLPLYNSVKWLSVGVSKKEKFIYAAPRKEKPIVAYGTSILQGAVASRPGLAWTNILERKLDREVINLGFSGNGRFEKPLFDLMAQTDAALYILDCMPNLTSGYSDEEIQKRVRYGVKKLRAAHPDVPIILTGHADGYMPFNMDTASRHNFHRTSLLMGKIYKDFINEGVDNIYLLSDKDIGFDINSTTEGLHANDIGMMKYAVAYEMLIRRALREPAGALSTEIPIKQSRDGFDWIKRHEAITTRLLKKNLKILLFGNSIINYWGGLPLPESGIQRGQASWRKYMEPAGIQNAGFGWDRIENVLWRVYHGALTGFKGDKIIVMMGTNNLQLNTDAEITAGLQFLLQQIHLRKPTVQIYMAGIVPRKGMEKRVCSLNDQIRHMALQHHFQYADFSKGLMTGDKVNPALFLSDGLHPNEKGYEVLGKNMTSIVN